MTRDQDLTDKALISLRFDDRRLVWALGLSLAMHATMMVILHSAPLTSPEAAEVFAPLLDRSPVALTFFDPPESEPEALRRVPETAAPIEPHEPVLEPAADALPVRNAPVEADAIAEPSEAPSQSQTVPRAERGVEEVATAPQMRSEDDLHLAVVTHGADLNTDTSDVATPEEHSRDRSVPEVSAQVMADENVTAAPRTAGADDEGGDVRRRYLRRLQRQLARLQNSYSPTLRRLQLEGTVLLSIDLDSRGRIVAVHVSESSGYESLDAHAVAQVHRLRRLSAPPASLGIAGRRIELPISYSTRA